MLKFNIDDYTRRNVRVVFKAGFSQKGLLTFENGLYVLRNSNYTFRFERKDVKVINAI